MKNRFVRLEVVRIARRADKRVDRYVGVFIRKLELLGEDPQLGDKTGLFGIGEIPYARGHARRRIALLRLRGDANRDFFIRGNERPIDGAVPGVRLLDGQRVGSEVFPLIVKRDARLERERRRDERRDGEKRRREDRESFHSCPFVK